MPDSLQQVLPRMSSIFCAVSQTEILIAGGYRNEDENSDEPPESDAFVFDTVGMNLTGMAILAESNIEVLRSFDSLTNQSRRVLAKSNDSASSSSSSSDVIALVEDQKETLHLASLKLVPGQGLSINLIQTVGCYDDEESDDSEESEDDPAGCYDSQESFDDH